MMHAYNQRKRHRLPRLAGSGSLRSKWKLNKRAAKLAEKGYYGKSCHTNLTTLFVFCFFSKGRDEEKDKEREQNNLRMC